MTGRRLAAELVGTWLLLVGIVGSGILAADLTSDPAIALLLNVVGTVGALAAAILAVGRVSGAHLNPAVSLAVAVRGGLSPALFGGYVIAQVLGAAAGAITANLMFGLAPVVVATTDRAGAGLLLAEFVATFGLVLVVWGVGRRGDDSGVAAVPLWVAGGMLATASTCFANPAVSLARTLSDTFTGIRPADALAFVPAELLGALAATAVAAYLFATPLPATEVVVGHETGEPPDDVAMLPDRARSDLGP